MLVVVLRFEEDLTASIPEPRLHKAHSHSRLNILHRFKRHKDAAHADHETSTEDDVMAQVSANSADEATTDDEAAGGNETTV